MVYTQTHTYTYIQWIPWYTYMEYMYTYIHTYVYIHTYIPWNIFQSQKETTANGRNLKHNAKSNKLSRNKKYCMMSLHMKSENISLIEIIQTDGCQELEGWGGKWRICWSKIQIPIIK